MLWAASCVLFTIYLILPAATFAMLLRGNFRRRRFILGGWISGSVLAAGVLAVYAIGIGGRLSFTQAGIAVYFAVSLMLFLKIVDAGLTRLLALLVMRRRPSRRRQWVVSVLRLVLFGAFALPWVMAAVMVYRPRVVIDDPPFALQTQAQRVAFPATDGSRVAAWYIAPANGQGTVAILCHGLGGNTAGFYRLIDALQEADVGVLAIDFRAHGDSAGQLCSFGYHEKNDVLGAVAWLKADHADASRRVIGVGASLGGAALLAAAAEHDGIEGVVILSTYATLADEVREISRKNFIAPLGWLVRHFGLPLASLHTGVDLAAIRPADDAAKLWPRPILIVHGTEDEIIPFEQGRRLYDACPVGRSSLWVTHGTHNGILDDRTVIDRVVQFILSAETSPLA